MEIGAKNIVISAENKVFLFLAEVSVIEYNNQGHSTLPTDTQGVGVSVVASQKSDKGNRFITGLQ